MKRNCNRGCITPNIQKGGIVSCVILILMAIFCFYRSRETYYNFKDTLLNVIDGEKDRLERNRYRAHS